MLEIERNFIVQQCVSSWGDAVRGEQHTHTSTRSEGFAHVNKDMSQQEYQNNWHQIQNVPLFKSISAERNQNFVLDLKFEFFNSKLRIRLLENTADWHRLKLTWRLSEIFILYIHILHYRLSIESYLLRVLLVTIIKHSGQDDNLDTLVIPNQEIMKRKTIRADWTNSYQRKFA